MLLDLGRSEEALTVLGTALAEEPGSTALLCLAARVHLAKGDAASALAAANAAVAADPDSEWGHRLASLALEAQGRSDEAVRAAEQAARLAPTMWQTQHCLAMAQSRAEQHKQAMATAHNAVRMAPRQHESHFALGYAAMRAGHKRVAREAFKRVLAMDPENSAALNNLAKLGMDRGRLLTAAHGFSASLSADPHSEVARYNIDVLARRLLLRLHWAMFALYLVLSSVVPHDATDALGRPIRQSVKTPSWLAVLSPALLVLFVVAIVLLDRRLPRAMRWYLRRLPRTDLFLGGWLALDLVAFGLLLALGLPQTPANRSLLVGLAFAALFAGMIVSRIGSSRMKKRRAALRS